MSSSWLRLLICGIIGLMKLQTKLGKLVLKNPVILASGTYDKSITNLINPSKLGGLVSKTITLKPRKGNPIPRIIKTKYGWLNSDGLRNRGIKEFIAKELPFWQKFDTEIIPSIGGFSDEDYIKLAKIFNNHNVQVIEVNVSCPNVEKGLSYCADPILLKNITSKIKKVFSKTLIIKLSPNVTDIISTADAALKAGADVLSIANTYQAMEVDNKLKKAKFYLKTGAYSGPAIKPITLRMVWQVYNKFKCPIIASGGIENIDDALDYFMVGASAITIGSANFNNPKASIEILTSLKKYLDYNKPKSYNEIKGI